MFKRSALPLFSLFILAFQVLYSQSINTYQDIAELEDYSDPFVFNTYQDSKGLLWIGTGRGLDRWDGHRMVSYSYTPFDTLCIPIKDVWNIIEDDQNNLWITNYSGRVVRFDQETESFKTIPISYENKIKYVGELGYDKSGFIWFVTREKEIFKYYPDEDSLRRIPIVKPAGIDYESPTPYIIQDTSGGTWFFDGRDLFGRFDPNKEEFNLNKIDLPSFYNRPTFLKDVIADSKGNFWLLDLRGILARLNPFNGEFEWTELIIPNKYFPLGAGIAIDQKDRIWYSTDYHLKRYDPVAKTATFIMNMPNPNSYTKLGSDNQGNILLSSINGVKLINSHKVTFPTVNLEEKLSLDHTPTITCAIRIKQTLWIGTENSGIIKYNIDADTFDHYLADGLPGSIPGNSISKVFYDRNGNLSFLIRRGSLLYRYEQKKDAFEYFYPAAYGVITQDETGCFCILDRDRIITLDPLTLDTTQILLKKPLPVQGVYEGTCNGFIRDKQGIFWFAEHRGGLYRIDPVSRDWTHYDYNINDPFGLPDSEIADLYCDSRNKIWISTLVGLSKVILNPKNDTAITFNNHLITDLKLGPTYRINEDGNGNIIVKTTWGVFLIRPDGKIDKYSNLGGLDTWSSFVRQSENLEKKELIFTAGEEIGIIPESFFAPDTCSVSTNLTEFRIFGEIVTPGEDSPLQHSILFADRIDLNHDQNFFRIGYAATQLSQSKYNPYRYFMEGINQDTVEAGSQSYAEYTDLKPGKYTFWVSGASHRGPFDRNGTSIDIRIHPPWYLSNLAIVIYFIVLISLVMVYIRIRTHKLKRETIRLESEVENQTREIKDKNKQILELDGLKTRFFNNISHEFRTLVTMVKAPAETLMEEEKISPKGRKGLEVIYRNANRLMNLVGQLLDISRIDKRSMKLVLCQENVFDVAQCIAASFAPLAEVRGIQYRYYLPRTDTLEWFDADKLEKVLNNLLSNAFKFTEEGGRVRLDMKHKNHCDGLENILEISVSDTGLGIPKDEQEKIFDRFYQAEANLKKEGGGTGIGLALTHELVDLMHGSIQVNSKEGKGSTFLVQIPLGLDHLDEKEYSIGKNTRETKQSEHPLISDAHREMIQTKTKPDEESKKPLLLVVEDNTDILWLLADKMGADFTVIEAVDGSAGLKLATEHNPDLVITDLMMPRMDGIELCQKLKTDIRTSHIPVIILTAKATMDDKMAGLETGADDYITKPFEVKEVLARSNNLVEQRRKLRERFSREVTLNPREIVITSIDEKFLNQAMEIIEKHISNEHFDVGELCKEMHMSRSTLFRKLDVLTNQSPIEFIRTLRLKRAAVLLKEKYGNVSEVALEVGFSNPSYFSKMFKKAFSVSPLEFVKLQST